MTQSTLMLRAMLPKLDAMVCEFLEEDIPHFDLAGAVVGEGVQRANIYAKASLCLAGVPFAEAILKYCDCTVTWNVEEGTEVTVQKGEKVCKHLCGRRGPSEALGFLCAKHRRRDPLPHRRSRYSWHIWGEAVWGDGCIMAGGVPCSTTSVKSHAFCVTCLFSRLFVGDGDGGGAGERGFAKGPRPRTCLDSENQPGIRLQSGPHGISLQENPPQYIPQNDQRVAGIILTQIFWGNPPPSPQRDWNTRTELNAIKTVVAGAVGANCSEAHLILFGPPMDPVGRREGPHSREPV